MDSEARFSAVFGLAYGPLCRYARHRGLTGPDAEDLVAQTLEIAWRRLDDVPEAEPLPWLYAVAHNLWRNQARRDRRRRDLHPSQPHPPHPADPGRLHPDPPVATLLTGRPPWFGQDSKFRGPADSVRTEGAP